MQRYRARINSWGNPVHYPDDNGHYVLYEDARQLEHDNKEMLEMLKEIDDYHEATGEYIDKAGEIQGIIAKIESRQEEG